MIPWDEIVKFELKPDSEKQILYPAQNPEKYFDDKLKRAQGRKVEKYGTHIFISPELTQIGRDELLAVLQNYLDVVNGKPGARLLRQYSQ